MVYETIEQLEDVLKSDYRRLSKHVESGIYSDEVIAQLATRWNDCSDLMYMGFLNLGGRYIVLFGALRSECEIKRAFYAKIESEV